MSDRVLAAVHPGQYRHFGEFGWSGVLRGAGVIFFAYIGFDAVSTAAQEAKHPQRDMPIGIFASLIVCTVLYVLVSGVMVGLVPYQQLGVPAPMALAVDAARVQGGGHRRGSRSPTSCRSSSSSARSPGCRRRSSCRWWRSRASSCRWRRTGCCRAWAGAIHPRFHTPHVMTIVTGVIVALAAGFTPINVLGELVSIGTLFAFVVVALGVIVLRRTRPDLERPFRTPGVPWLPALSASRRSR